MNILQKIKVERNHQKNHQCIEGGIGVEAGEIALSHQISKGIMPKGLEQIVTSSTPPRGLNLSEVAGVIVWAISVGAAFWLTKSPPPGAGTTGLAVAAFGGLASFSNPQR